MLTVHHPLIPLFMRTSVLFILVSVLTLNAACSQKRDVAAASAGSAKTMARAYPKAAAVTGQPDEFPVRKTDAEWRKALTPAQYYILRQQGTEPAFSSQLNKNYAAGSYYCAADRNLLFTSEAKFDSGTGWPSFFAPATAASLKIHSDNSYGMSRDAIVCASCGGHLGHVFNDGPAPTGLRYCMDGDAMVFEKKK
jgi:peptide-methionine (R)-S-oxide reductase